LVVLSKVCEPLSPLSPLFQQNYLPLYKMGQYLIDAFSGLPAINSPTEDRVDAFIRGDDGAVLHKSKVNSQWYLSQTGWQSLGGHILSDVCAVSTGQDCISIFTRGSQK